MRIIESDDDANKHILKIYTNNIDPLLFKAMPL